LLVDENHQCNTEIEFPSSLFFFCTHDTQFSCVAFFHGNRVVTVFFLYNRVFLKKDTYKCSRAYIKGMIAQLATA
jgi:hypothetical protein